MRNQLYSRSSQHNLAISIRGVAEGSTSKEEFQSQFWKDIQIIKAPWKILFFLWRSIQKVLPTKMALWKRRMVQDPLCPVCAKCDESSFHILFSYKFA
ncbi:hypothetical protein Sjap_002446 [Stephania japonica]|uniref:Reverse transcriptase zinc-binding domain-containing protein n=1 Tax=Stephania japonica TaxID=461633 RepID=A0AAP0KM37_9MAGN